MEGGGCSRHDRNAGFVARDVKPGALFKENSDAGQVTATAEKTTGCINRQVKGDGHFRAAIIAHINAVLAADGTTSFVFIREFNGMLTGVTNATIAPRDIE